ncbi:MAG TPA: hypothetical protein VF228_17055 [Iamia sp.]
MRRLLAPLALAALALVACGDGSDDTTTTGRSGPGGGLATEVVHIGEGVPPLDGPPAVQVLDPAEAAALFVDADAAAEAVAAADLDGRTLLGGLVHEGCFTAGGVSVDVVDDAVVFTAEDVSPAEGDVDCVRAVVTSALVAVPTDALPDGYGESAGEVPGEVVLLEPSRHESSDATGPGLVRDRVDLEAVLGRYGLDEPDEALLSRVETGDEVLVAGRVGGACELPIDVTVRRTGADLELVEEYDPDAPEVVCDEAVQGLVLIAVAATDVEGVETVGGDPA